MIEYINPMDDRYFRIINKQIDESPSKKKMWDKFLNVYEAEVSAEKFDKELFEIYSNGNPGSDDNMAIIGAMMEKKPAAEWIKTVFDITAMSESSTELLKDIVKLFNLQEDLYSQIERIKVTLDVEKQNSEKKADLLEDLRSENTELKVRLEKKMKSEMYYKTQSNTYRNKTEELKKENIILQKRITELEDGYKKLLQAAPISQEFSITPDKLDDMKTSIEGYINNTVQKIIENAEEYYRKLDMHISNTENNIVNVVNEIPKAGDSNLFLMDIEGFQEHQGKQAVSSEIAEQAAVESDYVKNIGDTNLEYTEIPEPEDVGYGYDESPEIVENDDEPQFSIPTPFEPENVIEETLEEQENTFDNRKISLCKVDLSNNITESSKKDESEEKKAGILRFFKFRVASEKKKREMLLNALLKNIILWSR